MNLSDPSFNVYNVPLNSSLQTFTFANTDIAISTNYDKVKHEIDSELINDAVTCSKDFPSLDNTMRVEEAKSVATGGSTKTTEMAFCEGDVTLGPEHLGINTAQRMLAILFDAVKPSAFMRPRVDFYNPRGTIHAHCVGIALATSVLALNNDLQKLALEGCLAIEIAGTKSDPADKKAGVSIVKKPGSFRQISGEQRGLNESLFSILTVEKRFGLKIPKATLVKILSLEVVELFKKIEVRFKSIDAHNRQMLFWMQTTALMANFPKNGSNALSRLGLHTIELGKAHAKTVTCALLLLNCAERISLPTYKKAGKSHKEWHAATPRSVKKIIEQVNEVPTSNRNTPYLADFAGAIGINITNALGDVPTAPAANRLISKQVDKLVESISMAISANL